MSETTIINAQFKTTCFECHFTIWKDEKIKWSGKPRHLNCLKALRDDTPRTLNQAYAGKYGKVSKKQMIKILMYKRARRNKVQRKASPCSTTT